MDTVHRSRRIDIDWLADGPIGPFVDVFKQFLAERRYAGTTSNKYLAGISHFARWARSRRLQLHRIDEVSVAQFLDDHLPTCNCAEPTRRDRGDHSAALGHLLVVLRAQGAIPDHALEAAGLKPVSSLPVFQNVVERIEVFGVRVDLSVNIFTIHWHEVPIMPCSLYLGWHSSQLLCAQNGQPPVSVWLGRAVAGRGQSSDFSHNTFVV
ncbi:MAG: hypothetical protein Q7K57_19495 [Burkholderiaceae bacterium]|nr:hypothetical protein [Burkholderiaceae bacterium]